MTALIVGGDYVEPLKREIRTHGHEHVEHWDGRKVGFTRKSIPGGTQLIVILCDYVSHSLSIALKRQANRNNVPLVFCRRSANDLRRKLDEIGGSGGGSCRREAAVKGEAAETQYMELHNYSHLNT